MHACRHRPTRGAARVHSRPPPTDRLTTQVADFFTLADRAPALLYLQNLLLINLCANLLFSLQVPSVAYIRTNLIYSIQFSRCVPKS